MRKIFKNEESFLFALAILLLLMRFLDLGTAPFIQDEPLLQLKLDDHFRERTVPWLGLYGTHGVQYGPLALWIYSAVRCFSDRIEPVIAWHALIFVGGLMLLYCAARRAVGNCAATWAIVLAASSPYYCFYSRIPWDNTFLVFNVGLMVYCVSLGFRSFPSVVALGMSSGLAFITHLMSIPAIFAAAVVVGLRRIPGFGLGFLLITAPYIAKVYPSLLQQGGFAPTMSGVHEHLGTSLLSIGRFFSPKGMDYFFDVPLREYFGKAMAGLIQLDISVVLQIAAAVVLARKLWQSHRPSNVVRFACLAWIFTGIYYWGIRPELRHPHYFMMSGWVGFFFAGIAIAESSGAMRMFLKATAAALIGLNIVFVLQAHSILESNLGTRGPHYGTAQAEIRRATSEICRQVSGPTPTLRVDISRVPGLFPPSVLYFSRHVEECRGKSLVFDQGPWFDVALAYGDRAPRDASLRVVAVQSQISSRTGQ